MHVTSAAPIRLTDFVRGRTRCTRLRRPNLATFPESACCICSAISVGILCVWCGAAPQSPDWKADFVEGTVDQAPHLTPGPFDLVFTTWGTICWLPDVKNWANVIASVLAPGGELYFADAHPGFNVLEECAGRLVPTYDFQTPADRPLQFANETTYTGDPTVLSHRSTREWIHSLSAVLGGLIDAGLAITMFHEHQVLPWRGLECLVPAPDGLWRLPDGMARIPLSYSVKAKKLRANARP
jgi:SAM-dependent methyltransferase